jgi:hypothetical protein
MQFDLLIPLAGIVAIAYSIKTVVEAYSRRRIAEAVGSEALLRELLQGEAERRRHASLHWGCVMTALALGFGLVQATGSDHVSAGAVALLLGATGLGNLGYYLLARRLG